MNTEQQKPSNNDPCIIGHHYRDPDIFLLSAPPVMSLKGALIERVRVLDMHEKKLYAPWPLVSILARAPYDIYTGDQSILPELLAQVEEVDD